MRWGPMDRCAILVDAGYLLGAAGTLVAGDSDRSGLEVDHAPLALALIEEAESQTGMPVLRLLWYDGAFNSQPSPEHRTLRVLPDVKVRLGELVVRGGRLQQKGVDSYLHRDLTTLSRHKAVADVVLLGGDEDLRRALEEAQDHGTRVHLWGVEAAAPEYNQSQSLIAEADRRWIIPAAWIERFVRVRHVGEETVDTPDRAGERERPPAPAPEPKPSSSQAARGAVSDDGPAPAVADSEISGDEDSPTSVLASQEDLERLVASFDKNRPRESADDMPGWTVTESSRDEIPRLRVITSSAQAWQDNEEDATTPGRTAAELGRIFGERWTSRASHRQLAALVAVRPRAPRHLDGELLRFAEGQGIDTWEDESAKHTVRDAFWEAVGRAWRKDEGS
jgi:uncharacterized LabA/DUF88 family protein